MGAQVGQRKTDGPLQMLIDASLFRIGKGNDFVQEGSISGLGDIFIDGGEKPEGIVCAVSRMSGLLYIGGVVRRVFLPRIVRKFYKGKSSAVIYLCRKHKADFFFCHFRRKMDDSLNILHRIPVAVAVAQTAVNQRGCTRPDKSDKTVIGIPGIDHRIKFWAGGMNLKMFKLFLPVMG